MSSTLGPNDKLNVGDSLTSANGSYYLTLQSDGNLVLYPKGGGVGTAIWAAGTNGKPASHLVMERDGNVVLYDKSNQPLWSSSTSGKGVSFFSVQEDGNLVTYIQGAPTWSSKTNK